MAIAVPDELQESVGPGSDRALTAVRGSSVSGRRASCKTSRERLCPGVLSGRVQDARWTQIDAIARADMPWRPVEWRLPCQVNCRKVWDPALRAVRGRSAIFLQNIARADVPWSAVWRGWHRSMDTNRCHRAGRCALEARGMAIAVPDELQESVGLGTNRALRTVRGRSADFLKTLDLQRGSPNPRFVEQFLNLR